MTLTAITPGTAAPGLTGFGPSANVTQAGPSATPQVLDNDVVFSDPSGNFNGGTLIVSGDSPKTPSAFSRSVSIPASSSSMTAPRRTTCCSRARTSERFPAARAGTPLTVTFNGHDDSFTALAGNERIDAGGGVDTITFGFKLTDATVSYAGNTVIIDGPSQPHGAHRLRDLQVHRRHREQQ